MLTYFSVKASMQYDRTGAQKKILNFQSTSCKNMKNVQETVINEKSALEKINLRNHEISIVVDHEKEILKNEVNNDNLISNIDSNNTNRYIINKLNHFFLELEIMINAYIF